MYSQKNTQIQRYFQLQYTNVTNSIMLILTIQLCLIKMKINSNLKKKKHTKKKHCDKIMLKEHYVLHYEDTIAIV